MADYNIGEKNGCLVGNWFEERALQDYAGHTRAPNDGNDRTYFRCVEHTTRIEQKEYLTSNKKDFKNPRSESNPLQYKADALIGPRERLMMERLKTLNSQPPPPRELPGYMESTASSDFKAPDLSALEGSSIGARLMKTRDLEPIATRDKMWLLEHNAAPRHICMATEEGITAESALIAQDVPITVYSMHPDRFPMSDPSQGPNPFGRHSAFTLPIEHYVRAPVKDL